jgi:hypothetical protein
MRLCPVVSSVMMPSAAMRVSMVVVWSAVVKLARSGSVPGMDSIALTVGPASCLVEGQQHP